MAHIEPTPEQFQAFAGAPIEGPIVMINLLKFIPDGGLEKYAQYGAATAPCLEKVKGRVVYQGMGGPTVIGGDEAWDMVLLVEYPNRQAFFDMVTSEEYMAGSHLRTEAVADSRLYHTAPMAVGATG